MSTVIPSVSNAGNKVSAQLGERDDVSWIRQSMLVPTRGLYSGNTSTQANYLNANRGDARFSSQFSYESLNFSDTSLGGNRAINPKHQFTFTADPKLPSLLRTVNHSKTTAGDSERCLGMGRKYAMSIEQHASMITFQFGTPAYNSLTNFYSGFYSPEHSAMANDGVVNGISFNLGKALGTVASWAILPTFSAFNLLYTYGKKVSANLQRRPLSKFYYMKPNMYLYWSTVITISNALLVNMKLGAGATIDVMAKGEGGSTVIDPSKSSVPLQDLEALAQILPDIWLNEKKGFDIRAVANRYARLANANDRRLAAIRDQYGTEAEATQAIRDYITSGGIENSEEFRNAKPMSFAEYTTNYLESVAGRGISLFLSDDAKSNATGLGGSSDKQTDNSADVSRIANDAALASESTAFDGNNLWKGIYDHLSLFSNYAEAELRDGSAFVNFYVEWDQNVSESFNHSTKESAFASNINSQSSDFRSKMFDFANGNIVGGAAGALIGEITESIKGVATGLLDAVGFSGLAALGGRAFVDIPDFWASGSAQFPSANYTIRLRTPYGNAFSIYQDLMVPTSMLLAGVMCRAAGRNAYTGPFLCKLWHKGRTQIQLGLISSMMINRGQGNVGWNYLGQPTGIDINFTVTNLSKMLYVPITPDLSVSDLLGFTLFDEDTTFTDYMAVLGSLGLKDQYYASNRWRLKRANVVANFNSIWNTDYVLSHLLGDSAVGSILSIAVKQGHIGN